MGVTIKGIPEMVARLQRIIDKLPDVVAQALYQEAQIEMTEAKRRVPVDTGVLRASGHVLQPTRQGRMIECVLAFGGAAEKYAVIVHEDLEAFHPVGQAKYLESVLKESVPYMKGRIARRIEENMLVA